jgi:hypothetical protein
MKAMLAAAAAILVAMPAAHATDVGVSIGISQPGVYGRIDIGRFPQPAVVVPQPVIIAPPPQVVAVPAQPVYMWVPPGHQKNWRKHCHRYNACGVPVYFVRQDWYEQNVRYASAPSRGWDDDRGHGKGKGRGHGRGRD